MRRTGFALVCAWVLPMAVLSGQVQSSQTYFEMLQSRPEHWLSFALRSEAELERYKNARSRPAFVTYDAAMDAAKVTIPAIDPRFPYSSLAAAVDADQTTLALAGWHSELTVGRAIKIDEEVFRIAAINARAKTVTVTRARGGTSAAPHAAGRPVYIGTNSLLNQVRLPIGAVAGASYLFTWDVRWSDSYLASGLENHKAFQFSNSRDSLWLELQSRFNGRGARRFNASNDVAHLTMRSYGTAPMDPIAPSAGEFIAKSNRWTRIWVRLTIDASGPDPMSMWIADEQTDPVQVYRDIPLDASSVGKLWLEFNTSTNAFNRANLRDLVAHVRNVVVLRNVADVTPLLVRPRPAPSLP